MAAAVLAPAFLAPAPLARKPAPLPGAAAQLSVAEEPAPSQGPKCSAPVAGLGLAVLGVAAAGSAQRQRQRRGANRSTSCRAFEDELGVQPPTGFWDPAGFTSDGDQFEFYRRRCVEIKHGRVSMLACIGYIVPEYFKFPGYLSPSIGLKFADVPHGLAALTKGPAIGWARPILLPCP
mmetsp:Transcript_127698/g.397700  ORF Transcript_127698/g.397700 Transcript_127698/m.397700 type:complete len:178 (+) Transcript_127698:68-601(+)